MLTADYKTGRRSAEGDRRQHQQVLPGEISADRIRKADSVKGAVAELQRIYRTTFFPDMKVNWKTHPNNIGHFYFQGCFRCHDGNHVSKDGKVISKDCNACHTLLEQEEGGARLAAMPDPAFQASSGPRRPEGRELLRLPQRGSRAVKLAVEYTGQ